MRVIGTAGHVDHGKSTLIKRLTGIDPDRLAEEKAREMTIDLGFAWLDMPDGDTLGIVDVPGHRDFIENMLAGIGGIDAVLLIIAADEGVMPQTREHLAIIDLLGIQRGIIVLTKTDLIDDPDWLGLVELDIREVVQNTALKDAPICPVSAYSGAGIPELIETLSEILAETPPRRDIGQPRLPVDRVFSMSGFGTIVTGTLLDGLLRVGEEIELLPSGLRGRIRGLQSYKQKVEFAYPGSRVAVNISGVDKQDILRGNLIVRPNQNATNSLIDVYLNYLPDANRPLKHNSEVKFFSGTAETTARVRLLADETIAPGDSGWVQLRLSSPVSVRREDRFILRYPSPPQTVGGGVVVNPTPAKRWKRFQSQVIDRLKTQKQGTQADRLAQLAEGTSPIKPAELQKRSDLNAQDFDIALQEAMANGLLVPLHDTLMAAHNYHQLLHLIRDLVDQHHQHYPLRLGISREEIRSRLDIKNATLALLLGSQDEIVAQDGVLRMSTHQIVFSAEQVKTINELLSLMDEAPFTPPSYSDAEGIVGSDVLIALIQIGEIIQVQPEVIFTRATFDVMVNGILALIDEHGGVSAKLVRDHFDTSRKYAIGILEYLDSIGFTKRVGDDRVRGKNAPQS
ncbi:MAG: selenocysteine-specific translation elongation factor [Aggregatilineales bacterium]